MPVSSTKTAIVNGKVFDGDNLLPEHAVVVVDGLIEAVVRQDRLPRQIDATVDIDGRTLLPGFIDLQVNGGGGVLFNDAPTVETIRTIAAAHRSFGTTGLLPTLITDDLDVMAQAIQAVDQAMQEGVPGVLGIHLEGPFLSREKSGIHDSTKIRKVDESGIRVATSLLGGKTVMTIAPEVVDDDVIRHLVDKGVVVCAGHSAATYARAIAAVAAGLSGYTHLFNAMTPLQSREPGLVGAAIDGDNTWFGIIADGFHVHPATLRIAIAAKKRGGVVLVTDAMPSVGGDDSPFMVGGDKISVVNGRCTNDAGVLAGSDLDMITAINNIARFAGLDWFEAVRMATAYPARALGIDDKVGFIRPGYRASFVTVDAAHHVVDSWVDGSHQSFG